MEIVVLVVLSLIVGVLLLPVALAFGALAGWSLVGMVIGLALCMRG